MTVIIANAVNLNKIQYLLIRKWLKICCLISFIAFIQQYDKMKKKRHTNRVNTWSKILIGPQGTCSVQAENCFSQKLIYIIFCLKS